MIPSNDLVVLAVDRTDDRYFPARAPQHQTRPYHDYLPMLDYSRFNLMANYLICFPVGKTQESSPHFDVVSQLHACSPLINRTSIGKMGIVLCSACMTQRIACPDMV